ncbi:MAG: thioesterase [Treponema sp.]|nr:thioesterase [Treponema sp.]
MMNCDAANPKGSGKVDVWQETYPVRFGVIDKSDRLTLDAMFQFFQEAAISHAENLSVGREDMLRTGQVWVLSRISVMADRRPNYGETITVRTWPRGGEKLFAIRDYDIRDKDDIPVVSARSGWLIIDLDKRRPLRPQAVMDYLPQNEGLNALDWGPAALSENVNFQGGKTDAPLVPVFMMERKALYTDVDYNGHVNNVRYIQWIEDIIEPQLLENASKMRFDINYTSEILSGESIKLLSVQIEDDKSGNAFAIEGRKMENSQTAFRAELRLYN